MNSFVGQIKILGNKETSWQMQLKHKWFEPFIIIFFTWEAKDLLVTLIKEKMVAQFIIILLNHLLVQVILEHVLLLGTRTPMKSSSVHITIPKKQLAITSGTNRLVQSSDKHSVLQCVVWLCNFFLRCQNASIFGFLNHCGENFSCLTHLQNHISLVALQIDRWAW